MNKKHLFRLFFIICLLLPFSFSNFAQDNNRAPIEITNGQTINGISGSSGQWVHYFINVPSGGKNLEIKISGGSGDADLYTRFGSQPSNNSWDCRPYLDGNSENCNEPRPSSGKHYIGLKGYQNFSNISLSASYTTGPDPDPNPGNKSFIVTAVQDNLNNNDLYLMVDGLKGLGYKQTKQDLNVSSSSLINYLSSKNTTVYHTGHGNKGSVQTSTGSINTNSTTLTVTNTIFATCLTLSDTGWRHAMGSSADTVSGYTKVSWDGTDDQVVNTFIRELKKGKSYPVSWYLANANISSLTDRWCVYAREGGSIIEYSARTNNIPRNSEITLISLDDSGKLFVAKGILENKNPEHQVFSQAVLGQTTQSSQFNAQGFALLNSTSMNKNEAIEHASNYLKQSGEWAADVAFDRTIKIGSRSSDDEPFNTAGWMVRFSQTLPDDIQVRGNAADAHKTLIVGENGQVVAFSKNWATISSLTSYERSLDLLSVSDALHSAKEAILNRIKQGPVNIISTKPVYGFSKNKNELIPAYGYQTEDNVTIVVNAQTGKLIN